MNKTEKLAPLLLIYGSYAVLCQLAFILLSVLIRATDPSLFLSWDTYVLWLESPVASITVLIGGAALFTYLFGTDKN